MNIATEICVLICRANRIDLQGMMKQVQLEVIKTKECMKVVIQEIMITMMTMVTMVVMESAREMIVIQKENIMAMVRQVGGIRMGANNIMQIQGILLRTVNVEINVFPYLSLVTTEIAMTH
jgi:hypothetical protein